MTVLITEQEEDVWSWHEARYHDSSAVHKKNRSVVAAVPAGLLAVQFLPCYCADVPVVAWIPNLFGDGLRTLPPDGISWNIRPAPDRIVAVGDIHGDLAALAQILRKRRLVSKKGRWKGQGAHLVLTGDLVGGKNARLVLEYVMRLERQAARAGGAVHALLGNHDVDVLARKPKKKAPGKALFRKYRVRGARGKSARAAFRGETDPAVWLRNRNTIIRIGRTMFTHAGVNTWALKHHPRRVNATVRAWIRYWQGVDREPDSRTRWVVAPPEVAWENLSSGPLLTDAYKPGKTEKRKPSGSGTAPDLPQLERILKTYRVERMVLGHAPVPNGKVLLSHPYYGDSVVMLDTKISDPQKGRISCLEIRGGTLSAHYANRGKAGQRILERTVRRLEKKT
jgi:hypothetical protein